MLRRNLIHCWPRPAAPYRRRGAPPSAALAETSLPPESVVVFGLARARWPRARADRAAGGRLVAPSSHFPLIMLEDDKHRSAPLIAPRSACSASSVRRGISMIVSCAAQGSVIQAGNSERVPSGCSITKWTLPAWCNRRTTTTRPPARGCSGYWIRTSKGCSWAVCRRLEGHDERDGAVAVAATLARGLAPEGAAWRTVLHRGGRLPQSAARSYRDRSGSAGPRGHRSGIPQVRRVRQVHLWLRQEEIRLPAVEQGPAGPRIVWKLPVYNTVLHLLTNPIYAGAYAFGRTYSRVTVREGRKRVVRGYRRAQSDWEVLLPDHHEGYISWEEFERNQRLIADNANSKGLMAHGPVRRGRAHVAGLCG